MRLSRLFCHQQSLAAFLLSAMVLAFANGCCCVQGVPQGACGVASCGPGICGTSSCSTGACGAGPLANLISCKGGCGDVYVDEWVSEPPVIDHCSCGGCGSCNECRPVRTLLKALWGIPYAAACGPNCGGCSSCGSSAIVDHGHPAGCNCGADHISTAMPAALPQEMPGSILTPETVTPETVSPEAVSPEASPTPAPAVAPTSARLNPASRRMVRTAGGTRR